MNTNFQEAHEWYITALSLGGNAAYNAAHSFLLQIVGYLPLNCVHDLHQRIGRLISPHVLHYHLERPYFGKTSFHIHWSTADNGQIKIRSVAESDRNNLAIVESTGWSVLRPDLSEDQILSDLREFVRYQIRLYGNMGLNLVESQRRENVPRYTTATGKLYFRLPLTKNNLHQEPNLCSQFRMMCMHYYREEPKKEERPDLYQRLFYGTGPQGTFASEVKGILEELEAIYPNRVRETNDKTNSCIARTTTGCAPMTKVTTRSWSRSYLSMLMVVIGIVVGNFVLSQLM